MTAWPGLRSTARERHAPIDNVMRWSSHAQHGGYVTRHCRNYEHFIFVRVGNIVAAFDGDRVVLARAGR